PMTTLSSSGVNPCWDNIPTPPHRCGFPWKRTSTPKTIRSARISRRGPLIRSEPADGYAAGLHFPLLLELEGLAEQLQAPLPRAEQVDDEVHAVAQVAPVRGAAPVQGFRRAVELADHALQLGQLDFAQHVGEHLVTGQARHVGAEAHFAVGKS